MHARIRITVRPMRCPWRRRGSGANSPACPAARAWTVDAIERAFVDVVDLATGRVAPPAIHAHRLFVADQLLLRELAHHGRLGAMHLA